MSQLALKPDTAETAGALMRDEPRGAMTPMEMISAAIDSGQGIEVLDKLMALQERWEANQGRKAFDNAVADAKAAIPPIVKNRKGHSGKYADFHAIASVVDPIIGQHGLSYRFRTEQTADEICVTCVLSHRDGHSETTTLRGPADKSGSKNAIQAIGSTLSYLQRYSLIQALGLAVSDDDDGLRAGGDTITEDQAMELRELAESVGADLAAFCKYLRIEKLADLPASRFAGAVAALEKKRGA